MPGLHKALRSKNFVSSRAIVDPLERLGHSLSKDERDLIDALASTNSQGREIERTRIEGHVNGAPETKQAFKERDQMLQGARVMALRLDTEASKRLH